MRKEALVDYALSLGAEEPGKARCSITGEYYILHDLLCGYIVLRFLSEDLVG